MNYTDDPPISSGARGLWGIRAENDLPAFGDRQGPALSNA